MKADRKTLTGAVTTCLKAVTRCPHCGRSLRYLTATEAAEELGVHRNTIQRWVRTGEIRDAVTEHVWGGPRYLVPIREVQRLRRKQSRSTG